VQTPAGPPPRLTNAIRSAKQLVAVVSSQRCAKRCVWSPASFIVLPARCEEAQEAAGAGQEAARGGGSGYPARGGRRA